MAKDIAIILNNAGLNAAVLTTLATQRHRVVLLRAEASTQPHLRRRTAFAQQVEHFRPFREHTLVMPFLQLMEPTGAQAAAATADPRQRGRHTPRLQSLLPLIGLAARFAAYYEAVAIHIGLRIGSQPDDLAQASEFVQVWNELIQLPSGLPHVEVKAPLLELEPWQVVDLGVHVSAPLGRTWSCLEDSPTPCGACPACRGRAAAFQQAAKPDPLGLSTAG